ncbi:hypothetical protein [Streptomyces sp. NPDC006285]|uniref:hypothetical protein n=1 Tax=Streptomyces sp. NPDC006285 TaxID=3364742 RepID=UPI0036CBC536
MPRQNIVLLYADQHRADVLGRAGNAVVVTPNIARLAHEGVRFARAWTEGPLCHGETFGYHQLTAKMNFYAPSVRVPAVIRPPGGTAEGAVDSPVQAMDLPTTLLDAVGAAPLYTGSGRSPLTAVAGRRLDGTCSARSNSSPASPRSVP